MFLSAAVRSLLLSTIVPCSLAQPLGWQDSNTALDVSPPAHNKLNLPSLVGRSLPSGLDLKVLPVGDSITLGVTTAQPDQSKNNGYRLELANFLRGDGQKATFIGTQSNGGDTNPDPYHEGYGFNRINDIMDHIRGNGIVRQQPNLILVHAGTNDNDAEKTGESYDDTPNRLGQMIDYFTCHAPDAVILVARLIENKFNQTQTNWFNRQIPKVVAGRYMAGYKVRVVDMSSIQDAYLSDLLHPTPAGYSAMAHLWYNAILDIPNDWWSPSIAQSAGNVETCARDKITFSQALDGRFVNEGAHVASDTGEAPSGVGNTFAPGWRDDGVVAIGSGRAGSGVHLADLDGDGKADYLWVDSNTSSVRAWLHDGVKYWSSLNSGEPIAYGTGSSDHVEFADLNGDKRAEYIVVINGHFRVFRNDGPKGTVWLWTQDDVIGQQLDSATGGVAGLHYFGDMNGDGKADMAVINSHGVLDFYIQEGDIGTDNFSWRKCLNKGFFEATMTLVDIDGDGRADYLTIDKDGGIRGWLNKPGGDCDITWVPINGGAAKSLALGAAPVQQVRLADMDGDGKADYAVIDDDIGAIHLFSNIGTNHAPDTMPLGGYGAAVRLNDIDGDGKDDYLSVTDQTGVLAFLNGGQSGGSWVWNEQAGGNVIALGYAGGTRHEIRFADMNGDGRDDYVVVDDATGAIVQCYLSQGPSPGPWSWSIQGEIAIGVGGTGAGVRLADVTGDGRADYIYLDADGSAKVWINRGPYDSLKNWESMNNGGIVALGVGAKREDVQFADVDGDGLADYVWIHPDTGSMEVWYNNGPSGSALGWVHGGILESSTGYSGAHMRLARIGSSGRADYVGIEEKTGAIKVWLNQCSQVIGHSGTHIDSEICGKPPMGTRPVPEDEPVSAGPSCNPNDHPDPSCLASYVPSSCLNAHDYHSIDDVANDHGIPEDCVNRYLLNALAETMDRSLSDYNRIMKDDYSDKYNAFLRLIRHTAITAWTDTIPDQDKYWDCVETDSGQNSSQSCGKTTHGDAFYYLPKKTLCDDLSKDHNIDCSWLYTKAPYQYGNNANSECTVKNTCVGGSKGTMYGEPDLNKSFILPDPSALISKALNNYTTLNEWLTRTSQDAQHLMFPESEGDAVNSAAIVVLSVEGAVQSMQNVADAGEQEEEEERKNKINAFLTAFLLLIPGIGEAVDGIESLVWVGRLARMADYGAQSAVGLYSVVEDPSNIPAAIAGMLMGGAFLRDDFVWAKAAARGRSMDQALLKDMGDHVNSGMSSIRKLCQKCK